MDYYDSSGYDCELKQSYKKYTLVQYEGTVKVGGVERDVSRKVFQNNEIDWYKKLPNGKTNLELAMSGNAPIGKDGTPIELHHVLQKEPGCMVEIESSIHSNNHQVLHGLIEDGDSFRNDPVLNKQYKNFKRKYWRWRAENVK